jgi:proteasome lid subunit RPN8/RPN11
MTAIDYLTAGHSLKNSQNVKITPKVKGLFSDALDITLQNKKEIGIYACGNEFGDRITLTNGMIITSNTFDRNKFTFNIENHPSIENGICNGGGKLMALAHTHPDGNCIPSKQDRFISKSIDLLGCLIGIENTKCFYGDKDFTVID